MTSPRSTYGGGYYSASAFPDTPIYDSLVAERGTPQIAPIRVPAAYDTGGNLPALPSALPALPAAPSQPSQGYGYGYPGPQQPAPLQQAPAPYIPQQAGAPRGYPGPQQYQGGQPGGTGYDAMRPATPRPAAPRPVPGPYEDPYGQQRSYQQGRGY
ncbi:hypothetical protein KBZ10_14750 [Streptomyces sp. F63]|uniref:DUF6643 family protein n=1 Tax=Streptomyces sp. F63 TaxID=2824887 RepID=UPI001B38F669|nr:DUF6643 family protein [Streptomyces sp. F63]MBQ0985754.1 hypothetical protein [Streptomyces sp. F63]